MKIGILTMFNGLGSIYSLVNVVSDHIRMLLDGGYAVKLLVSEDLNDNEKYGIYKDDRIEWAKICNRYKGQQIIWRDYSSPNIKIHSDLMEEAKAVGEDIAKNLEDVDICMMHDILYQGWHLVHNLAVIHAKELLPGMKFIAMTHSLPDETQVNNVVAWPHAARYQPLIDTLYVYPSSCGLKSLSRQYHVDIDKCRVLNNTLDLFQSMNAEIRTIHEMTDLLSPDILIIYPARLTTGKRFEKVAMVAGALTRISRYKVKVIFCEYPSMDIDADLYKKSIRKAGTDYGLSNEDIVFTSDLGYPMGLSRNVIFDLFTLSNLYICPSLSESFGLTLLEAASRGNYLVVNEAVPALLELGKELEAYFLRWDAQNFGFSTQENYFPNELTYYEDHCKRIIMNMEHNPVIQAKMKVRKRYSPKWVFENQLKPLLMEFM